MRLFKKNATAEQVTHGLSLKGKTALVTGCNSGLGFETMRVLALRGARVIGTARTLKKAKAACSMVEGETFPLACELSGIKSIQAAIMGIEEPLDIVIANAGIMALQEKAILHGFEKQMFINHIGHSILINGLLEKLTKDARIIIVASGAHAFARGKGIDFDDLIWNRPYKPWVAYGQSKLANILYTKALSARLPKGQTVNCLHPGIIDSPLWRHVPDEDAKKMMGNKGFSSIEQGAATTVFLAMCSSVTQYNGEYFSNGALGKPSTLAQSSALAEQLWEASASFGQRLIPVSK